MLKWQNVKPVESKLEATITFANVQKHVESYGPVLLSVMAQTGVLQTGDDPEDVLRGIILEYQLMKSLKKKDGT